MFGAASNNKISPLWLEYFQRLALEGNSLKDMKEGHIDGWGIAGYLGKWTVHFGRSSGSAAEETEAFEKAAHKAVSSNSKIVVAHMRSASEGKVNLENSHPFIHGEWIFCHNGTIESYQNFELAKYQYEGGTDSERFFKYLIDRLGNKPVKDYPELIREAVCRIKDVCKCSSLSFLLANDRYLMGFRDYSEDEDYYTLYYSYSEKHSLSFCSEPIPGFDWEPMANGQLIIADKEGGILYGI
jgi:glutamine amidotransferase